MLPDIDIIQLGNDRILTQDRDKDNFVNILNIALDEVRSLYAREADYVDSRYIDGATGEVLDTIALLPYVIRPSFGDPDSSGYFGFDDDPTAEPYNYFDASGVSVSFNLTGGVWSEVAPARYAADGGYFGFSDDPDALGWGGGEATYETQYYLHEADASGYQSISETFIPASDDIFRAFIHAKARANYSAVTTPDYIDIITLASMGPPVYVNRKVRELEVVIGDPSLSELRKLAIERATPTPAGVKITFLGTVDPGGVWDFGGTGITPW
jgi:hypothetical protein